MKKKTKVNIKLFCILLVAVILISSVIGSLNNIAKADINDNEQYIDIYNNDLVFTPIDSVDYENSSSSTSLNDYALYQNSVITSFPAEYNTYEKIKEAYYMINYNEVKLINEKD